MMEKIPARLGVTFLGAGVFALSACGTAEEAAPAVSESAVQSGAPVTALPDGVPLPVAGTLVDKPETFKEGGAQGWSAVALAETDQGAPSIAGSLNEQLTAAGWTEQVTGNEVDGVQISATRRASGQAQWLSVTVTPPLPGGGSAVTYRYASGEDPFAKGGKNQ